MKKALRIGGIGLGLLLAGLALLYWLYDKPLPQGEQGAAAEALADRVLMAIDKSAWDSTRWVAWDFRGAHQFVWDKAANYVEVRWGNGIRVLLRPDEIAGQAYDNGKALSGADNDAQVRQAWAYFCNDGFWLNAPAKLRDPGTERRLVKMPDGSEALLVSYESGGTTPGDSYLWLLDRDGRPHAWQMWVSIIPLGGLEFSWENWQVLPTGAMVATLHRSGVFDIPVQVQAGMSLADIGLDSDPFADWR